MSNTPRACTVRRLIGGALLALCIGLAIERAGAQQQGSAGANVNVISGTGADGDWTLQRQNEPSIACSSRNPLNCLAGANDYRTVDIPFPTSGEKVTGDAWLGWYTTKNGGLTWRTRLLPGYPQDTSAVGHASPLRGYAAGADPVIRPGTNGLFYYGGLVFNREEGGGSAIFVARFIDNNNQEGTAGEPIDYLGASIVHRIGAAPTVVARRQGREGRPARATAARRPTTPANTRAARVRAGVEQPGTTTQMVDKPWIAVDVPRAGAQTCSIGGAGTGTPLQTFPGGRVYMAYALFDGPDEQRGRIMFSSSANCGATWSAPRVLSRVQSADVNDDGMANATDVNLTRAALGRVCGHPAFPSNADYNNDCKIDIVDLTLIGRAVGQPVPTQPRLSQGATIAIDPRNGLDGGAVQITWRQFDDGVLGDAIVTVRSVNGGASFSSPRMVATLSPFEQGTTDTSFRTNAFPTMAMDGTGRAYLAWSARGHAVNRPSPIDGDGRVVLSTSVDGVTWSTPRPVDNQQNPGHQIMPALAFAQGKLQLIYYDLREDVSQLFGPFVDELPILAGPPPRVRHTVDVWGAQADPGENPLFTPFRISQYRSGGAPGSQTVAPLEYNPPNLPIFRAGTSPFMGDYLDVATDAPFVRNGSAWSFNNAATASPVFHGIWTDNRDIRPPANGRWTDYTPPNPPFARPAMSGFDPTQAIPACVPGQAGMRNQNIYTARITRGLVVGAVGNSRRLGSIQRSFPVFAQNNGTTVKSYRLTITNQPVGGQASFKQFEPLTTLDVQVPRRSTVARTVFARSTDPFAQINVSVTEIAAPGGAPVTGGQQGTIVLNPDPTNPDLENPDLENPDLENPDLENSEVHNPDLENATTRNPDLENPDLENPDLENPDLENTRVANPSIINPDLENPDLENPDLENPDLENPDLENPDLENGALSDTTWTVTNKGNTASAYTVRLALNRQLPEGFRSQLIAHKIYQTPAALGCSLLKQSQTVLIANIPTARFVTPGELANPDLENPDLENLTVAIAPGETVRITLRVYDPVKADAITFRAAENVTPVAVAQAVNTPEADQGITQPAAAGVLTSSAPVPGGTSGGDYTTTLTSTLPGTWTVAGGTVPPGLTVDPATGGITGTPTTPGTYTFTARFQSTIGIIDYRTVTITVGAVGADANVGVAATGPGAPVAIGTPFAYTLTVSNVGPAAASNVRLTDTLPEGTQFVSATTTAGTCQHANGTLLCTLGTLESGAAATIVLNVRPTTGGSHTNRAVVSADQADPVATNNAAVSTATSAGVTPCTTVCFSGPTAYVASTFGLEFGAITGDFNEDGHVDLAYGPAGVNTVGILLGNGTGGFGAPRFMTIPGSPDDGRVADFNNDGHLDLVIMSHEVAQAWVFLGNGLGEFAAPAIIALPNTPENVVPADFNRDGNVDLALSGNGTGPLVMILLGNGNGTFQAATTIGTATASSSLVVDDFNNDSNPDLAVHTDNVGLTIILGNGPSGFQPATAIPVPNASGVVKVGDLTGDGFADLIVGTVPPTGPSELRIYVGNGTGGFAPGGTVGDPALTNDAPATGDLDSDGDLDFVWARTGGGVGIQLNDGLGNFAAPFYLSSLPASQPIIADLNGDGRPDLVLPAGAPFMGQSQVLVFLNTCDRPPADLAITLEAPAGPIVEGTTFTYTAQVTNNGPNTATGVQLDVTVLGFGEIQSIGGASGCSIVGFGVTCQLGALASGATAAVTVEVLPVSGGSLQAHAGVTGTTGDPNPANNAAFTQTAITPGASTLTVTNVSDGGPGSLRLAMLRANDGGPRDTIVFNIPGAGVHTIRPPALALPGLGQPVVIDGTTQPGYSGTPLIEIDGTTAGTVNGLGLFGGNSIIRGLALNRFRQAGIFVGSAGNTIEGNFIGTDPTGTLARPNGGGGIDIRGANNTIGGTTAGTRNLISGNNNGGINISTSAATGNVVVGNFIGTNAAGTAAIGNGHGVNIVGGASNTTVGGTASGARNILSGNSAYGVRIADAGTSSNRVLGNFVGTNATGTAAIPNGLSGVFIISGASGNTIGGTQPAEGNVISGNSSFGVAFFGAATDVGGNTVLNNFIGTDAAGTAAIGNNASGVFVETSNNRIGSLTAGVGNTIAFNGDVGVRVGAGTGNAIVNNRIFSNASLGIDLAPLGVTANDAGDTDTGANNLLNHPVLSSARIVGANVLVQVALSPTPPGPGQIHFYANSACDASGSGEGQTPIGVSSFGVNPGGDTNFEASFSATQVPAGSFITATATDSGGNTSEFSPCALVAGSPGTANLGITKQDSPDPVTVGSPLTYLISVNNAGPDASSNAVVTDVLPANVTLVSAVSTGGGCSGTTTVTCTLNSIASGAGITISIVVTPTAIGTLTNTATVTATGTDPDEANNSATSTTIVTAGEQVIYVVTNTDDSGIGSLRQAIGDANAHFGPDTIRFNIPGAGVRTINLASALPQNTEPVTIDGTSQPGFAGTPLIELNGAQAGDGANGLVVNGGNSVIRSLIINRWSGSGIVLQGGDLNVVERNWLGTGPTGTTALGNGNGILVSSSGNTIGENVISGNTNGVHIGLGALGNAVHDNLIGTDVSGTLDVGNTEAGVLILGEANAIGGPNAAARNVISGNDEAGVRLTGGASANSVQGNLIGVNASGTGPLANGIGVQVGVNVDGTASTNVIGGVVAGAGNEIAFNTTIGVVVGQSSSDNAIFGNSIHQNGTLGIDLIGNGVTQNDLGDTDEGANNLTNFPVLTGATGGVQGTLNSIPDTTFRIEFFGNTACDASGNGEGQIFLGSTAATTDATGNATIPLFTAAAGQFVTATATDGSNNTSEFSACVTPLAVGAEIEVSVVDTPDPVVVGGQLSYAVTVTNNGPGPATNVRLNALWNGPFNVDATSPSGTCELTPLLFCTFGTLASGATASLGIVGTPGAIALLGSTFTLQADEDDPVPANNAVAVNTSVVGGPFSFVVSNTNDTGAGSLRQAILSANASAGADVISFALGSGPQTITVASPLPAITGPTTIDGTTQPGFTGTPLVELNGNGIVGNGLTVSGPNTTIRGLIINRFVGGWAGISITGASATNAVVQGNYIGTNAAGTVALPNSTGVSLGNLSSGALIGGTAPGTGNVISGNASAGIVVQAGVSNATIQGNLIGLNLSGTAALANAGMGIQLDSGGATVGGIEAGARNVISGNGFSGVQLSGGPADSNTILGNYIGTNIDGTGALPNQQSGILITNQARNNTVGGVAVGAGNVISGNGSFGIFITDPATSGNLVQGNLIGTNATGTAALPNAAFGVFVFDSPNNQIGGSAAGAGNLISGNGNTGVALSGSGTLGNLIQGNRIGTNAAATSGVPNTGHGVSIQGATNNRIGGAAGNIIRFNNGAGVRISTALSTSGNFISGNSIADNLQLGIDLGPDGVQPNDAGDADSGANNLQNFPVLTASATGVEGTLNSIPNTTYRIEFFGNTACDASGNGEGATFLGTTDVVTDGTGNAAIPLFTAAAGQFITATATDQSGNTSEFSACLQATESNVRTWISDTGGFWEDPANWSDGIVPIDGDIVVIDRPTVAITVTVQSASVALESLRSEEQLNVTGGSISFAQASELNAGLNMSGGVLGGAGDLTLGTFSLWTGGQMNGPGSLVVRQNAGLTVSSPGQTGILGRTLINHGTVLWDQAVLQLTGGAQITNRPTAVLQLFGNLTIVNNSGVPTTVTNEGTITRFGPNGDLTLTGVAFVTSGNLFMNLGTTSDRLVSDAAGTLGGSLLIGLVSPFVPTPGAQFELFRFASRTGTFTAISGGGQVYLPTYTATGLTVTAVQSASADLELTMTDAPDPVAEGGTLTYTLTITNHGPDAAQAVTGQDLLNQLTTFVSAVPSQGSCSESGGAIVCPLGTLASGASATIVITGTAHFTGTIINSAFVSSTTADANLANNIANESTTATATGTTFTVTTTANSGVGSLRQAILDANAHPGADRIEFAIPGAGVHTISPTTFLPTITEPVVIDGTTQGGNSTPLIELNGTNAGRTSNGLFITGGGTTIRGLAINRFGDFGGTGGPNDPGGAGIVIQGTGNNIIENNIIGMDAAGLIPLPNRSDGIFIDNSPNNRIGGTSVLSRNLISGNGRSGMTLSGSGTTGTIVQGNYIGPDITEAQTSGPQTSGIAVFGASGNTLGDPAANAPNLIAFNGTYGVEVRSGNRNSIQGNRMFGNNALGIDLDDPGLSANDPGDIDTGANDRLNHPTLALLSSGASGPRLRLTLDSTPSTAMLFDFYISPACDPVLFGEGASRLALVSSATGADGLLNVDVQLQLAAAGQAVTATTTDPLGNTSEFSNCITVPHAIELLPETFNLETFDQAPMAVFLTRPAGAGGQVVDLGTSDVIVFTVPPTVTINEGEFSGNVTVTASSTAGSATLSASAAGFQGDSALVVVTSRAMTLNVSPLVGLNRSVDGTVDLARPAPAGGVTIALASSAPAIFTVNPANVTIPAGSTSAPFTVNGLANGNAQLSATAGGFNTAATLIEVTGSSLISLGQGVVVAPGNSAGLSLSLGIPAPAGGVTVSLISSNSSVATVTPSVFIPAGLQVPASNPVITGVAIGTVQIGATASGFAPDSTSASVTVSIGFSAATLNVVRDATANITLQLSAPAPANGLTFNLSIDNTAFATVPPTITIAQGLTSGVVTVTGVAVGSTTLRASAPGIAGATATVNVVPPPAITMGDLTIGRDLQTTLSATLGIAAPAGGVSVTITSADPQLVRLSTTAGGTGQPSISMPVAAGSTNTASFFVQAFGDTGTIQLTASATGYATDTSTVDLRPSGFIINSPSSITTTTLASNSPIQITPARLNATTLAFEQNQAVRAGLSVEVPVTSSNQSVGVITVSPVTIGPGGNSASTQFDPIGQGTSTIAVGTPAGFSTPSTFRQFVATVNQPTITLGDLSVGRDLQVQASASLGAPAPAGGVTVTVTSLSPGAVLVSNSAAAIGSESITVQVTGGSTTVPGIWVQSLADAGTPEITLSAPGFAPETTTVTLAPSAFIINSPGVISTNSFAANTSIQITSARLNASLAFVTNQPLRAGITADVPITSSNPTVGTITASPLHFAGGTQSVNTSFDPAQSGTTTISVGTPAGFNTSATFRTITATVSAPNLTLGSTTVVVGLNLQTSISVSLQSAPPSPVDVSVTVETGGIVALSSNATTVGGNTVVFSGVTSTSVGTFFVQGLALGSTTLTGHADGYNDNAASATVHPSGFIINSPGSISTNTFALNTSIQITSARLNPGTLAFVQSQPLRAGIATVDVPVTSSDTTVGVITASPLTFGPNVQAVSTTFDALSSGTTTIAVGTPAGFDTSSTFRQISATVTAPNVNISSVTVGRDLQTQISVTLDVAPPSPITVTVRSNATSVATLTANGTVAGGDTVTFTNVTSTSAGAFFVQGRSLGTTTLTAQAAGYDDGTANVTVDPSGFIINSPQVISTNTLAVPTFVQITPARLNPGNLNFVQSQAVRGGVSVDVPVTVSNPAVGVMTVSPVTLGPGVNAGNTAFNPESVGTTVISLGTPTGFSQSSSFTQITATVVTPGINVAAVRVGRDLQTTVTISLDATPPTPITVTVQSDAIGTATITQNGLVEGGGTVTFNNVTSTNVGSFLVQGRAIGTTTLTTQAVGYEPSTSSVTVDPSGFIINSPAQITTTVGAQNTSVQITPGRLDPISLDWAGNQSLRGGLSVNVPVTSSNPTVGVMTITSVPFGPGVSFSNTAFDPLAVGTTTISVASPAGFTQSGTFTQIPATVNQ